MNDKKKEIVWDPDQEDQDNDLDSSGLTHFLFLKQAVLGAKAKPDERNVVEVQAEDFDGNTVKQPLFSLKLGLNES
ncbi:hypothetical protein, partial [Salmonella sp. s54395]|uniref:hypothetical protein n=1 Tax=Salmonella sp. s54395 TaxID=3159664 RepID=UPI00397EE554